MADFVVTNHGSVWNIMATSPAAKEFAEENFVDVEPWMGKRVCFTTDWRPAYNLLRMLQDEGWDIADGGRHY